MASLTEQLDALTKQLETVNSEYAQLINACSQKEKEQDQILENIDQLNEQIKLASLTTAIELEPQRTEVELEPQRTEVEPESQPTGVEPESQPTEVEPESQPTGVEPESLHKSTFVMYGEGLIERVLGLSGKYDEEEDDEPKEVILPPLDKKLFPALAALQEKHPIILKRGPNKPMLYLN